MFGTVNEVENSGKVSWNRSESGIGTAIGSNGSDSLTGIAGTVVVYILGSFNKRSICCLCMLTSDITSSVKSVEATLFLMR